MSDLVAFLRARLDEEEEAARAATPGPWFWDRQGGDFHNGDDITVISAHGVHDADADHVSWWNPARVLAEVEAKRRIVAGFDPIEHPLGPLLALAQVYADHPDFDPTWRTD